MGTLGLRLTFDAELFHSCFEGRGLQVEDGGGTLGATYAPVGLLQDIDDVLPLHLLKRQELGSAGLVA